MNEKLTQIAIEAKVEHCISHVRLEEFAELIVKECARVAFESDLTMAIGQWGADSAILKHFGVEG